MGDPFNEPPNNHLFRYSVEQKSEATTISFTVPFAPDFQEIQCTGTMARRLLLRTVMSMSQAVIKMTGVEDLSDGILTILDAVEQQMDRDCIEKWIHDHPNGTMEDFILHPPDGIEQDIAGSCLEVAMEEYGVWLDPVRGTLHWDSNLDSERRSAAFEEEDDEREDLLN